MAYENEDLQKQLEDQLNPQPMPGAEALGGAAMPEIVAGGATTGQGINEGLKTNPNTGVTGGKDMGSPMDATKGAAFKKSQAEGYTDIEGAGGLKTGNYMGALEGFNTGAWGSNERGSNTLKNSFGKIASRYDPTQPGAAKALMADPDFMAMFPDAVMIDHPNQDQIDFDGPGGDPPVDVIRAAQAGGGGQGWQWGTQDGGGGGGSANVDLMGGNPSSDIEAQLAGLVGGQDAETQALIQKILSGEMDAQLTGGQP